MAKLNKDKAKKAAEAEALDFEPFAGAFHAKLVDVDASREGPKGPYWSWEYEVVEPGERMGRHVWNNTSLADNALFSFNMTFDAFGVPTDTDTDELIGKVVKLICSIRTIQSGDKKGQPGQQVDRVVKADEDFEIPEGVAAASGKASGKEEDIFA